MTKLIKLIYIPLFLVTCLVCHSVFAKSNDYQIELIVFRNNNMEDIYKESWPNVTLTIPEHAQKISDNQTNSDESKYYKLLNSNSLISSDTYKKIKNNSNYTAVSHISWLQPKKDLQAGKTVYFNSGVKYQNDSALAFIPEISGTIKFSQKKYVHAALDLLLNIPVTMTNDTKKPFVISQSNSVSNNSYVLQPFSISEQRRLKNGELNYFDNPAFGAILIVKEI